jgi:GT2 family glycosyltransferase
MKPSPKVGVVTITYNSARVIDGFLRSLLAQSHGNFVLYLVDNASTDDTLKRVAGYRDHRIHVIANSENKGFAEANNQGFRIALDSGCDLALIMNNDTEFEPQLIQKLIGALDDYDCDLVTPKILFFDDPARIWSAGGGLDPRKGYSGFHHGYDQIDRGQFDTPRLVDHGPGCCLLLRKEVFDRIGMLDQRYFTYVEDTDFSYRAKRAGLKLMYLPSATVLHKAHSLTGGLFSDFMMRYTTRNRIYFMLKHFGWWRGLYYVPAYQTHLLLQLLSRQVGLSMFWLREKAFFEGLRLWRHSLAETK